MIKHKTLEILKKIIKEEPGTYWNSKFVIELIEEIEELKMIICKCAPVLWVKNGSAQKAEEWEEKISKYFEL